MRTPTQNRRTGHLRAWPTSARERRRLGRYNVPVPMGVAQFKAWRARQRRSNAAATILEPCEVRS